LTLLVSLAAGCGQEGPELLPVDGAVTLDDQPLPEAQINFIPDPTNPVVTPGEAVSNEDGSYRASYMGRGGLAPGRYKVTVQKFTFSGDTSRIPKEILDDPEQLRLSGISKQSLPPLYAEANRTPFQIEVASGGGPYNFTLSSKAR
jgi:predicted small lipoprotein YifL